MNTQPIKIGAVVRTVCEQGKTDLLGLIVDVIADEDESHIATILWNDGALSFMDGVLLATRVEILEVVV